MIAQTSPASAAGDAPSIQVAKQRALQRQLELLQDDAARLRNPDIAKPFSSLQDAVDRLLPYHILAARDADELDDAEATPADDEPSPLIVDRATAWQQLCLQQTLELAAKVERMQTQIVEFQERVPSSAVAPPGPSLSTAEDLYLLEHCQHETERIAWSHAKQELYNQQMAIIARRQKEKEEAALAAAQAASHAAVASQQDTDMDSATPTIPSQLKSTQAQQQHAPLAEGPLQKSGSSWTEVTPDTTQQLTSQPHATEASPQATAPPQTFSSGIVRPSGSSWVEVPQTSAVSSRSGAAPATSSLPASRSPGPGGQSGLIKGLADSLLSQPQ